MRPANLRPTVGSLVSEYRSQPPMTMQLRAPAASEDGQPGPTPGKSASRSVASEARSPADMITPGSESKTVASKPASIARRQTTPISAMDDSDCITISSTGLLPLTDGLARTHLDASLAMAYKHQRSKPLQRMSTITSVAMAPGRSLLSIPELWSSSSSRPVPRAASLRRCHTSRPTPGQTSAAPSESSRG